MTALCFLFKYKYFSVFQTSKFSYLLINSLRNLLRLDANNRLVCIPAYTAHNTEDKLKNQQLLREY